MISIYNFVVAWMDFLPPYFDIFSLELLHFNAENQDDDYVSLDRKLSQPNLDI